MTYDRAADRYLDKVFPQTRQVTGRELEAMGVPVELYNQAEEITARLTRDGVRPTIDQVVVELRKQQAAAARRGI